MFCKEDFFEPKGKPVFMKRAEKLVQYLKSLSFDELQTLLRCNPEIARLNFERYRQMDLSKNTVPALFAYDGIQYKYMAPQVFESDYFDYVQNHLYILSGLYGVLRPFDGVVPYRLEMQAKLKTNFCKNLYDYWGDALYTYITSEDYQILNLASKEYYKAVSRYFKPKDHCVTCIFAEPHHGKLVEKGVYVKMARGEMVRFLAEQKVETFEEVKQFSRLDFTFREELSNANTYVFVREKKDKTLKQS